MARFFTIFLFCSFFLTSAQTGFLDAGYGAINIKIGWQSSNPESWVGHYKYPTYGIGLYSGFLGNAQVILRQRSGLIKNNS